MTALLLGLLISQAHASEPAIRVQFGFVYKIRCEGRLLVSAVGNDALLQIEALPKETGCGLILKPRAHRGVTNLIVEASTGTFKRLIEVGAGVTQPRASDLEIFFHSDEGTP